MSGISMIDERRVLVLQARNLGDAVISTALVETIAQGLHVDTIDVLTRPEIAQIFGHNSWVNQVFTCRFPMGSLDDFGLKEALAFFRTVTALRRRQYTDVINLEGDFREEMLGKVITSQNNWSPAWSANHPCSKVIRRSIFGLANRPVPIPSNKPNVHEATAIVGMAVSGAAARKPALYTPAKDHIAWNPEKNTVGIHPTASQPWRRWEMKKWAVVTRVLIEHEINVNVFGSPSEAEELHKHFGQLDASRIKIVTGSLSDYFAAVSRVRVLLCHDSFASHVAYALGVPTILLNGANDATAWAPPGTVVLAAGPELKCYPCYNRPTCFGTPDEYACVRRIEITSVLARVWDALDSVSAKESAVFVPSSTD